ncbi:MAG: energy transducer TonB [Chlorobi bacterium]|nr:energy transducer TonB [Chlorobiota bacterium]
MKIDKDKRRGIIGSIIVHIILFISLFLIALRTPLPLPGEEGVEVNLGYSETGIGNVQSDNPPPKSKPVQPKQIQSQSEPQAVQEKEEIIKQNIEDTPAIEEKTEEKAEEKPIEKVEEKKPEPIKEQEEIIEEKTVDSTFVEEVAEEVTEPEPKPVVNKRALFTGTANNNTQGTNQGIAGGIGDQGKPKGFKDSDKYDGRGGKGNGPSVDLGERGSLYLDEPNADFKEQGYVVVDIWVNRNGKVVKAQVKSKGTNILDKKLRQKAVDAAKNSKFESDSKAEELQRGTITYKFMLLK